MGAGLFFCVCALRREWPALISVVSFESVGQLVGRCTFGLSHMPIVQLLFLQPAVMAFTLLRARGDSNARINNCAVSGGVRRPIVCPILGGHAWDTGRQDDSQ